MRAIDYFDRAAVEYPDRVAVTDGELSYSYRELHRLSCRISQTIRDAGFIVGTRACIYATNHPNVWAYLLGIMRAGGVWISLNPRNPVTVNAEYLSELGVQWLFHDRSVVPTVESLRATVSSLRQLTCIDDLAECAADTAQDDSNDSDWADVHGNVGQLMALFDTGGTTGKAKPLAFDMQAWATTIEVHARYYPYHEHPVWLSILPLAHRGIYSAFSMLTLGGTHCVMCSPVPSDILKSIERFRVTHTVMSPIVLYGLLSHPSLHSHSYESLRMLLINSAAVAPTQLGAAVEAFGPCLYHNYGQMDAGMISWLDADAIMKASHGINSHRLRSCGKPCYSMRVEIADERGRLLPRGTLGEIIVRGRTVRRYYRETAETRHARRAGWHHTGDIGYIDSDGYLYIVDRTSDMIVTGGCNVYSNEVEATIMEMPQVKECVVIGVPHRLLGEAVIAFVVERAGGSVSAAAIIARCREFLSSYKTPVGIEFRETLPSTPLGKYDKKRIRQEYLSGQS